MFRLEMREDLFFCFFAGVDNHWTYSKSSYFGIRLFMTDIATLCFLIQRICVYKYSLVSREIKIVITTAHHLVFIPMAILQITMQQLGPFTVKKIHTINIIC